MIQRGLLIDSSQCNINDIWDKAMQLCKEDNKYHELNDEEDDDKDDDYGSRKKRKCSGDGFNDEEDDDGDGDYGKRCGKKRKRSGDISTVTGPRQFIDAFLSHQRHGLTLLVLDEVDRSIIYRKFQNDLRMVSDSCEQHGLRILLIVNRSGIKHGFPELHVPQYTVEELISIMQMHVNRSSISMDVMEYIARTSEGAHQALAHLRLARCHATLTIDEWKKTRSMCDISTVGCNERVVLTFLLKDMSSKAVQITKVAEFYSDNCMTVRSQSITETMQTAIDRLQMKGMIIRLRDTIQLSQLSRRNLDHIFNSYCNEV